MHCARKLGRKFIQILTVNQKTKHWLEMTARPEYSSECPICAENVQTFKVLQCNHQFCPRCTKAIAENSSEKNTILCPICRQTTKTSNEENLPNFYLGKLKCDICLEHKPCQDYWWCPTCIKIMCSKCSLKEHLKSEHKIHEWGSLQAIADLQYWYCHQEALSTIQQENMQNSALANESEAIHSFCVELEKRLQAKLLASIPTKQQEISFAEVLQNIFGEVSTTANEKPETFTMEKANSVLRQAIKLAEASSDLRQGTFWEIYGPYMKSKPNASIQRSFKVPEKSVTTIANNIWEQIQRCENEVNENVLPPKLPRCVIIKRSTKGLGFSIKSDNNKKDKAAAVFVSKITSPDVDGKLFEGDQILRVNAGSVLLSTHDDVEEKLNNGGDAVAIHVVYRPKAYKAIHQSVRFS